MLDKILGPLGEQSCPLRVFWEGVPHLVDAVPTTEMRT